MGNRVRKTVRRPAPTNLTDVQGSFGAFTPAEEIFESAAHVTFDIIPEDKEAKIIFKNKDWKDVGKDALSEAFSFGFSKFVDSKFDIEGIGKYVVQTLKNTTSRKIISKYAEETVAKSFVTEGINTIFDVGVNVAIPDDKNERVSFIHKEVYIRAKKLKGGGKKNNENDVKRAIEQWVNEF